MDNEIISFISVHDHFFLVVMIMQYQKRKLMCSHRSNVFKHMGTRYFVSTFLVKSTRSITTLLISTSKNSLQPLCLSDDFRQKCASDCSCTA